MERTMAEKDESGSGKPDPGRLELLRRIPKEVMETLTREEVHAMLHDDEWPDSLQDKLKDFLE